MQSKLLLQLTELGFSVPLVRGYAHVSMLLSVANVTLRCFEMHRLRLTLTQEFSASRILTLSLFSLRSIPPTWRSVMTMTSSHLVYSERAGLTCPRLCTEQRECLDSR